MLGCWIYMVLKNNFSKKIRHFIELFARDFIYLEFILLIFSILEFCLSEIKTKKSEFSNFWPKTLIYLNLFF